ncbi:MAG: DUF3343 domain-containing protein [Spirochaetaceae bacterium]|jgi:hypothetical protein|nr:DUF3343 domain-containing protein [Spirochaetaceae bacterium]
MSESDGLTGPMADGAAEYIFSFANTRDAIDAEKKLIAAVIPAGVMPLPVDIGGAGCGICLRVSPRDFDRARMALNGTCRAIYAVMTGTGGRRERVFRPWKP